MTKLAYVLYIGIVIIVFGLLAIGILIFLERRTGVSEAENSDIRHFNFSDVTDLSSMYWLLNLSVVLSFLSTKPFEDNLKVSLN